MASDRRIVEIASLSSFALQMVSYKIVKADNGDAWVEVLFLPCPLPPCTLFAHVPPRSESAVLEKLRLV